jgi:hypothetical protein
VPLKLKLAVNLSKIMSICSPCFLGSEDAILTILQHSECSCSHSEDELWNETNPDIEALKGIIKDHFNSSCQTEEPMKHGAYARVFLYTLQNGLQVIARVTLPVRKGIKTESEIGAMDMVRGKLIRSIDPREPHSQYISSTNLGPRPKSTSLL